MVYQVNSKSSIKFDNVKQIITQAVLGFLGELETAKSGFLVMNDFKDNKGIIKMDTKHVDLIRTSLALVSEMDISAIKVSGTLKKAREGWN